MFIRDVQLYRPLWLKSSFFARCALLTLRNQICLKKDLIEILKDYCSVFFNKKAIRTPAIAPKRCPSQEM
jgi:hypothetical protein